MTLNDLPIDDFREAVKIISENRAYMTEGKRNQLTTEYINKIISICEDKLLMQSVNHQNILNKVEYELNKAVRLVEIAR